MSETIIERLQTDMVKAMKEKDADTLSTLRMLKSALMEAKTAKPTARMRIVWAVVNDAFKQVGTPFEYTEKEAALARAAELTAKGKGTHFLQKLKEAMPEDAPGLGAVIPRHEAAPIAAAIAPPEDDEEIETEEEAEEEEEEVEEDDDD